MLLFFVDNPSLPPVDLELAMREGVCCSCQLIQPIVPKGFSPEDEDGFLFFPPEEGEAAEWVMDTHDVYGGHCEGSGIPPQAVLPEEKRNWADMTDGDIKAAVRRICNFSTSDQEVKDRLRQELGYQQGAEVVSSGHGSTRTVFVTLASPRGHMISI